MSQLTDHDSFPQVQTPIADEKGYVRIEWRQLFQKMWVLAGGGEMSVTSKNFIRPQLVPAAISTLYVSDKFRTRIDKMTVSNSDAAAHTITIYLVPSGQSAGPSNEIVPPQSVSAGASIDLTPCEGHILEQGDTIQTAASADMLLTIDASGVQITSS